MEPGRLRDPAAILRPRVRSRSIGATTGAHPGGVPREVASHQSGGAATFHGRPPDASRDLA